MFFNISSNTVCIFIIGLGVLIASLLGISERLRMREGFENVRGMPAIRCGVDLPTCASGTQCMNGFCVNYAKPSLTPNELPVYP